MSSKQLQQWFGNRRTKDRKRADRLTLQPARQEGSNVAFTTASSDGVLDDVVEAEVARALSLLQTKPSQQPGRRATTAQAMKASAPVMLYPPPVEENTPSHLHGPLLARSLPSPVSSFLPRPAFAPLTVTASTPPAPDLRGLSGLAIDPSANATTKSTGAAGRQIWERQLESTHNARLQTALNRVNARREALGIGDGPVPFRYHESVKILSRGDALRVSVNNGSLKAQVNRKGRVNAVVPPADGGLPSGRVEGRPASSEFCMTLPPNPVPLEFGVPHHTQKRAADQAFHTVGDWNQLSHDAGCRQKRMSGQVAWV